MAEKWVLFWSVFYGMGEPILQGLAFRESGFVDPLGVAAVLLGGTLLGSLWLIRCQPAAGRLLNALGWGAFLVLFCGEVWLFYTSLGWHRADPVLLAGPGVPVALSCLFAHLLRRGRAR
ncbi:MAG TPA: hypothetical protein VEP28_11245 [Rubrobacter sp.]|nr:hypothetical protein [Rubrobacter sp.]